MEARRYLVVSSDQQSSSAAAVCTHLDIIVVNLSGRAFSPSSSFQHTTACRTTGPNTKVSCALMFMFLCLCYTKLLNEIYTIEQLRIETIWRYPGMLVNLVVDSAKSSMITVKLSFYSCQSITCCFEGREVLNWLLWVNLSQLPNDRLLILILFAFFQL